MIRPKMYSKIYQVFFIFIFLIIQGCANTEDFPPKSVPFEFIIQDKNPDNAKFIAFNKGTLLIESIEFEGIKEDGNNYVFESNFDSIATANLQTGVTTPEIKFDIPQGIYNRINLAIKIPDHNNQPSLMVEGIYDFPPGKGNPPDPIGPDKETRIKVVINFGLMLELNGITNKKNKNEFVFNQNQPGKLQITIDPDFWFRPVTPNLIRNAEISEEEEEAEIVISKTKNERIFELIINRIEPSTEAVFIY